MNTFSLEHKEYTMKILGNNEVRLVSGRIADTGERCKMRPTGFWTGTDKNGNYREITSYERADKEEPGYQYSMDRRHRFYLETVD